MLQQAPVEVGQRVMPGANLARVANPLRLKAALQIPETQAKDVDAGQPASIDIRSAVIPGRVSRKDPAAVNGAVTVDVALTVPLPREAGPDLNVDGTIQLQRLEHVLHVSRPAFGQENSTVALFRVAADGSSAARVSVRFGSASSTSIVVVDGLREGDRVILSDMSTSGEFERIRLR